jgi:uncharacterized protein (PEP-CTERM system associated)
MKARSRSGRVPATRVLALGAMAVMLPARAAEAPTPEQLQFPTSAAPGVYGQAPAPQAQLSQAALLPQAARRGWFFVPSIALTETYTDNVALVPDSQKEADFITTLSPRLRIEGNTARARLNFDYRRDQLFYAGDSRRNTGLNFLNALGRLEAVENQVFVEAGGTISQQAISAFGAQPTSTSIGNTNSNRAETLNFFVSPYARGRIGSAAEYEARYRAMTTRASGVGLANSQTSEWSGFLKSSTDLATIGWALNANQQTTRFNSRPALELSRVRGSVLYHYDPELTFSLLGGVESNNYASQSSESRATYGVGFDWAPGPRTRAKGTAEKGFFGDNHDLSFSHRTPRSSWQYTDSKAATVVPNQLALARPGSAFDLLFDALTSRFPDPVVRAQEVERQLQQNGIPANLGVTNGFLTSQAFVQRTHQASVGLLGVRNTIIFTAALVRREGLAGGGGAVGDFIASPVVDTRSISASWAHQLSPLSSVNLLLSSMNSKGATGSNLDTTQNTVRVLFSHAFSRRTQGTLGARYITFDSTTGLGFTEKAITASIATTF